MPSKEENTLIKFREFIENLSVPLLILGTFLFCFVFFYKEQISRELSINLSLTDNSWSHYGFKSLKNKLFELEKNKLNLEFNKIPESEKNQDQRILLIYQTLLANSEQEIQRYSKEMKDIKIKALTYDRDFILLRSKHFFVSLSLAGSLLAILTFLYSRIISKLKEVNFVFGFVSLVISFILFIFALSF